MPEETSLLDIQFLPAAGSEDPVMAQLADLINQVYAVAEDGLWLTGAHRTTVEEVVSLTKAGQIAVARLAGRIVGCVRVQALDGDTGEFGMLAADPAHRGTGIGRELVRFAEQKCRADGHTAMQLEILVPRTWSHPSKEFLIGWYTRIGYRVLRSETIDKTYPELASLLATTCDFVLYSKDLHI
jgi:GNAT superfamily N-acetyltransferase